MPAVAAKNIYALDFLLLGIIFLACSMQLENLYCKSCLLFALSRPPSKKMK